MHVVVSHAASKTKCHEFFVDFAIRVMQAQGEFEKQVRRQEEDNMRRNAGAVGGSGVNVLLSQEDMYKILR